MCSEGEMWKIGYHDGLLALCHILLLNMDILLDVFLRDYSAYEGSGMEFYIWIGLLVLQLYVSLLICGKYCDFLVRFHPVSKARHCLFAQMSYPEKNKVRLRSSRASSRCWCPVSLRRVLNWFGKMPILRERGWGSSRDAVCFDRFFRSESIIEIYDVRRI